MGIDSPECNQSIINHYSFKALESGT